MESKRSRTTWMAGLACLWIAAAVMPAWAIHPTEWGQGNEADFGEGTFDHTVVTSMGEVELSRMEKKLAELSGEQAIVYDLVRGRNGKVYAAIGPMGEVAQLDEESGELKTLIKYEKEQVFKLAVNEDGLWVGVSGEKTRVEQIDPDGKVARTIDLEGARYIWDIIFDGRTMWVATGTPGKVWCVDLKTDDAKAVQALETKQDNVLCLGQYKGTVYAGTDKDGLVYRIQPQDQDNAKNGPIFASYILFDADEAEIGTLWVTEDGIVYVGTASADQAKPGRMQQASEESKGRPEKKQDKEEPIKPEPNPNPQPEPQPITTPSDQDAGAAAPTQTETDSDANAESAASSTEPPTPEQYDELREVVRQRLIEARQTGGMPASRQAETPSLPGSGARVSSKGNKGTSTPKIASSGEGNAIYRIDRDGFVREVFRESVMILKIIGQGDALLVSTGNEGQVYRVDPQTSEVMVMVKMESTQIPAMLANSDGTILVGAANPGGVSRLSSSYADEGNYESPVLDAVQVSLWGKLQVTAATGQANTMTISTRSGNVADPENGPWSRWSEPADVQTTADGSPVYLDIRSPAARFLQYRVTMNSDGQRSPTLQKVKLRYVTPNFAPRIDSIKGAYAEAKGKARSGSDEEHAAQTTMHIEWEAADPNGDKMRYKLEARQVGSDGPYVEFAKDIEDTSYDWDTRTMPDGWYVLRITASDAPDNVPSQKRQATRLSSAVVIDNTPPTLMDVRTQPDSGGLRISFKASDAVTVISEVRYSVNQSGEKGWNPVLPSDMIYDSTTESFSFSIADLSPGQVVIGLRVTDAQGNSRYATATATVPDR